MAKDRQILSADRLAIEKRGQLDAAALAHVVLELSSMRSHGQARHGTPITLTGMASTPNPAAKLQHVRPVRPLTFPVSEPPEEHLGQSLRHWELCALLGFLLRGVTAPEHSYGADQFIYWNPREPRRCLAPDGFVKLGVPFELVDSWKTWDRGVPELAIEILSPSDTPERWALSEKLERYHELGVRELVCFDLDGAASTGDSARLRVWDLVDGDLVERVIEGERTVCLTLSALGPSFEWTVGEAGGHPAALRLVRDSVLVPLDSERLLAAHARIAELEAALRGAR